MPSQIYPKTANKSGVSKVIKSSSKGYASTHFLDQMIKQNSKNFSIFFMIKASIVSFSLFSHFEFDLFIKKLKYLLYLYKINFKVKVISCKLR